MIVYPQLATRELRIHGGHLALAQQLRRHHIVKERDAPVIVIHARPLNLTIIVEHTLVLEVRALKSK